MEPAENRYPRSESKQSEKRKNTVAERLLIN
jgi:hypothetical protein